MYSTITLANDNVIIILQEDGYEYFVKEDIIAIIPVKYLGDYVYVGEFLRGVYSLSSGVNPEDIENTFGLYLCPICGEWDIAENMIEVRSPDGEYAHQDCVENSADYFECEVCGVYHHYDYESGDYGICEDCSENYTRCSSCGAIIDFEETFVDNWGDRYCEDCYNEMYPPRNIEKYDYLINDYYYKPEELVFHYEQFEKDNPLFLGLEIECEPLQDWEEMLTDINGSYGSEDTCYLKYDSSVHNGAVEIVFQPRTLASYFKAGVLEKVYEQEVITTDEDGMHIHLNRDWFRANSEIVRFINFFQQEQDFIFAFSGRSWEKFQEWAKFYNEFWDYIPVYQPNGDRYHCVNITNEKTIEVRIFAAPSDINTAYANMQFVYAVAMLSREEFELPEERWNRFLEIARHFEYLWQRLCEIGFTKKKFIPASYYLAV